MIQVSYVKDASEFRQWVAHRLDGATRFHIAEPKQYPCAIAWMWCNESLHTCYIYKDGFDQWNEKTHMP